MQVSDLGDSNKVVQNLVERDFEKSILRARLAGAGAHIVALEDELKSTLGANAELVRDLHSVHEDLAPSDEPIMDSDEPSLMEAPSIRNAIDEAVAAAKNPLLAERSELIKHFRAACGQLGDNDWDDGLALSDIFEKHLMNYVHAKIDELLAREKAATEGMAVFKKKNADQQAEIADLKSTLQGLKKIVYEPEDQVNKCRACKKFSQVGEHEKGTCPHVEEGTHVFGGYDACDEYEPNSPLLYADCVHRKLDGEGCLKYDGLDVLCDKECREYCPPANKEENTKHSRARYCFHLTGDRRHCLVGRTDLDASCNEKCPDYVPVAPVKKE